MGLQQLDWYRSNQAEDLSLSYDGIEKKPGLDAGLFFAFDFAGFLS